MTSPWSICLVGIVRDPGSRARAWSQARVEIVEFVAFCFGPQNAVFRRLLVVFRISRYFLLEAANGTERAKLCQRHRPTFKSIPASSSAQLRGRGI